jgi:uncharacterized protein (DUF1015 family)
LPLIKPFRALRYELEAVGDLGRVTSPPYDVIGPAEQRALLARHPRNVVRLDLPGEELGDEPDDRYRRAARTFAAWRSDGTFHKDPRPSLYAYEQAYTVPGTDIQRTQRGFFGRLHLEPLDGGSVLPHERTLSAPKEDRYKLLRATGANMSPVIGLYEDASGRAAARLAEIVRGAPLADVTDDDGIRHRMWAVPTAPATGDASAEGADGGALPTTAVSELVALASAGPITIADGHHRYETALRYRDERRMSRSCEEDPAFDYVLMLFLESTTEPLTVLPTHRLVLGLGSDGAAALLAGVGSLFEVRAVTRDELATAFAADTQASDPDDGGRGRFGLWTRAGGAILTARREAFEPYLPAGGAALRRLDVTLLQIALDRLAGIDPRATAAGRVSYTKSVTEALDAVDAPAPGRAAGEAAGSGDAIDPERVDAAFLLEATPVAEIVAVARDGDVMPQKSTYFYPKPLSGLIINPHEW